MKSIIPSIAIALLAPLFLPPSARAQVAGAPATIDLQSHVLDTAGQPLAADTPTNFTMQFRIYDQQVNGAVIWAESQVVTVDRGLFSVRLGSGEPIPVGSDSLGETRDLRLAFNGRNRFLGLTVLIPGQTAAEITPRMAFLSSPFALVAERAKAADSATNAATANSVFQTAGTSTLNNTTIVGTLNLSTANISGTNRLNFGAGSADLAGKVGYSPTEGSLEIQGASATPGAPRKIFLRGTGGVDINGDLRVGGKISGDGSGLTGVTADLATESIDLSKLVKAVQDALCPVGTIVAYSGDTPPRGWLMCDGRSFTGTGSFKPLFDVIGTRFGNADGSANRFRVPDFRGRFLRGRDGAAGRDPDAAIRFSVDEGAKGDRVGSVQTDAFKRHDHDYYDVFTSAWWVGLEDTYSAVEHVIEVPGGIGTNATVSPWLRPDVIRGFDTPPRTTLPQSQGGARMSSETRPANVYVNYIIKK